MKLKPTSVFDGLYGAILLGAAGFAWQRYRGNMDGYEQTILWLATVALAVLGWNWRASRVLVCTTGLLTWAAIASYGGELARAEHALLLKYLLSSASAILWMS